MTIRCRGVRGATTTDANTPEGIWQATRELLLALAEANGIGPDDVASVFFTTTPDLDAAFPARAARDLGWNDVPLLGAVEMSVPGQPERCIRVLVHWNTEKTQREIVHVYMRGASALRPDHARPAREAAAAPPLPPRRTP